MYAIDPKSLKIERIMIALTCMRNGDAIESDVTMTEQRVEETIGHARDERKDHIHFRGRNQYTPDVEFDIEIYILLVIGRYKKFQIVKSTGAMGLCAVSIVPSTNVCIGLWAKISNSLLTDAISAAADMTLMPAAED